MREEIRKLLEESGGEFLSGEAMSERLGVSRAAVWKHIEGLRREGLAIEAVTRKGYRLTAPLPAERPIRAASLRLTTRALGRHFVGLAETDSTNAVARALAREGCPAGTLVTAETQKAGRGRRGRSWINAPGRDICMSLVLRPRVETQHAPRFTIATALGVYRMAVSFGLAPGIKWPNDILLGGAKLCGILLEMEGDMERLEAVIVGLGLNVNTAHFPPEIPAASLGLALGRTLDRGEVLSALLNHLEPLYDACESESGFAGLLAEYRACCGTLRRPVRVESINETFEGIAEDVDELGRLLVRDESGVLRTVGAGDVSIRQVPKAGECPLLGNG